MTEEQKIKEQKLIISELRKKNEGLSQGARKRHRQEILQLKKSILIAQEAVDSEEFFRIKNIELKEENRQLKQDKIKLERKVKFMHKEYERIINEHIQSTQNQSSDQ